MSTDIKKAYRRFRQFGGVKLLREYAGMGLVGVMLRRSLSALFHGRTLKSVYPALLAVTVPYLLDKYRPLMPPPLYVPVSPRNVWLSLKGSMLCCQLRHTRTI